MKVIALTESEKIEVRKRISAVQEAREMCSRVAVQEQQSIKEYGRFMMALSNDRGLQGQFVKVSECGNYLVLDDDWQKGETDPFSLRGRGNA
jgi:hypothetical protein